MDLKVRRRILYSIRNSTGNQCRDIRTGVIFADFGDFDTIQAALCWMSFKRRIRYFGRPNKREFK
jgi:hypothetical protein